MGGKKEWSVHACGEGPRWLRRRVCGGSRTGIWREGRAERAIMGGTYCCTALPVQRACVRLHRPHPRLPTAAVPPLPLSPSAPCSSRRCAQAHMIRQLLCSRRREGGCWKRTAPARMSWMLTRKETAVEVGEGMERAWREHGESAPSIPATNCKKNAISSAHFLRALAQICCPLASSRARRGRGSEE